MAISNDLNISEEGVVYFNGTNTFIGIDGSTAGNVLTSNGTNVAPSFKPALILSVAGTLTSQEIKNLHGTPIVIIPGSGAGTYINILSYNCTFKYGGSNAFIPGTGSISLYYGTSVAVLNTVFSAGNLSATVNRISAGNGIIINGTQTNFENIDITLYNSSITEISGNAADDNIVTYYVHYEIITI